MSKIAVYVSGGIGDVVLHMGYIRALAEQAQAPITLLLPQPRGTHGLFASQPYIADVIPLEDIHKDRRQRVRRLRDVLREHHIDALFLFSFQRYVLQAAWQAGVRRRVGFIRYHQPHLAWMLTHRGWVRRRGTPHPDTHTWLPPILRRHGYANQPIYPSLLVDSDAQAQAQRLCQSFPRLVGIGLNASVAEKRYDGASCAQVINALHRHDRSLSFLLFGAADVAALASQIRQLLDAGVPVLDITDKGLDIRVSHALAARCLVFAGNDSMGLHLAVAHKVPSVGLFGATPPMRYTSWLHPIVSDRPGDMTGIAPAAVTERVQQLLPLPACTDLATTF